MERFHGLAACVVYLLAIGSLTGACGSSGAGTPSAPTPSPTPVPTPSPAPTRTYFGVIAVPARPGKAAAITLSTNGTGTILTKNGNSGVLNGQFTSSTNEFTVSGLGYQIVATVSPDGLIGTGTQVSEPNVTTSTVGLEQQAQASSLGARISALPTDALQTWAGTAASNAGAQNNCGNPTPSLSQFQFVLRASGTPGSFTVRGQAVNDTDQTQATFKGTATIDASGTGTISITVDVPAGAGPGFVEGYAKANGSFSGSTAEGKYSGGSPLFNPNTNNWAYGCEQGTWTATRIS